MIRIFIVGDSTAVTYDVSQYPMQGWGQRLQELFDDMKMENRAVCGRSSKSFIDEGRLEEIEKELVEGDYLLIQFGHNDQKEDEERHTVPFASYKHYLRKYIETARNKGAQPVLLTPIARRRFDDHGNFIDTHGDYITAVKELAEEQNVPLIDMNDKTTKMIKDLGREESKKIFMWVEPDAYPAYPDGQKDDTHLNEQGAIAVARLVVDGIMENSFSLKKLFKKDYLNP